MIQDTGKNQMEVVWKGRTKYFDEIVDTIASAGVKYEVDKPNYIIKVEKKDVSNVNGMLCELNELLQAGW